MLVCVERKTAIAYPLKARLFWTYRTVLVAAGCIVCFSLLISSPSHITHEVISGVRNDTLLNATTGETTIVSRRFIKAILRPGYEPYWRVTMALDAIIIVILPVLIVLITNISIITSLKQHKSPTRLDTSVGYCYKQTATVDAPHQTTADRNSRNQRRATLIVQIIAFSFAICQTPSALIHLSEVFAPEVRDF